APSKIVDAAASAPALASVGAAGESSGSSLTIDAPWLLPTQKVTGVVRLSTKTRRTLVARGRVYSMKRPVAGSSRRMRSLYSPPLQTLPFLSAGTSYRYAPGRVT